MSATQTTGTYYVKGGRTGTKAHASSATSSVTNCGLWLRVQGHHYHIADVTGWDLCERCFPEARTVKAPVVEAPAAPAKCPNTGTIESGTGRIYQTCKDCGYNGKMGHSGLRAHTPAN